MALPGSEGSSCTSPEVSEVVEEQPKSEVKCRSLSELCSLSEVNWRSLSEDLEERPKSDENWNCSEVLEERPKSDVQCCSPRSGVASSSASRRSSSGMKISLERQKFSSEQCPPTWKIYLRG